MHIPRVLNVVRIRGFLGEGKQIFASLGPEYFRRGIELKGKLGRKGMIGLSVITAAIGFLPGRWADARTMIATAIAVATTAVVGTDIYQRAGDFEKKLMRQGAAAFGIIIASAILRWMPGRWAEARMIISSLAPFAIAYAITHATVNLNKDK